MKYSMEKDYGHKPVLLDECMEALAVKPDGTYLDGTLGRAGHSLEILRHLTSGGRLIGIDRDLTAIAAARERLAGFGDHFVPGSRKLRGSGKYFTGIGHNSHRWDAL